ncbi:helix-turn-helix domain-containing protein [Streptomyces mirabilis]|uniref:helix-turn-helix domain-containing protein n=1 Tax=Streptomyces mirabilis TaxID=68239 RepID=UPI003714BEA0
MRELSRRAFPEPDAVPGEAPASIDRVRAVLADAADLSWAELAALTGYYDRSHMTSDFRTFMGVPPRSYVTGQLQVPGLARPSPGSERARRARRGREGYEPA